MCGRYHQRTFLLCRTGVNPCPILGAVIGNTVGTLMYQIAKDKFSETEQAIIGGYLKDIEQLDAQLSDEFQAFIKALNANFEVYVDLVSRAFSPDVETALNGSMNLAKSMGVPTEEILDSKEKSRLTLWTDLSLLIRFFRN